MRVRTIDLLKQAYADYAVAAVNVFNMEQIHGLFRGAEHADAPVIVQLSRKACSYAGIDMLAHMMEAAEKMYPDVIFSVHLDHGDEATCYKAIEAGFFSSVMIDASHYPFDENVAVTHRVVEAAHAAGLHVEAELGVIGGAEDDLSVSEDEARYTDPDAAHVFVDRTACDSLAVAVGNSHGAYKFSGVARLQTDRLARIQDKLPGFPLVLHGCSSIPPGEVARINAAGGLLNSAGEGPTKEEISNVVGLGITKVNIATDGRLVWTRVHRESFRDHPDEIDLCTPGEAFMSAWADCVVYQMKRLGSTGRAHTTTATPHIVTPEA